MKLDFRIALTAIGYVLLAANLGIGDDKVDVRLPKGVKAVWEPDKAYRETTPTRERICINGLWRWQPALDEPEKIPRGNWGYFKVPGCWPGITDYMQKDCQTVFGHPAWKDERLGSITAAWYQRKIAVPEKWGRRRIVLSMEYVNSHAVVYVDGKKAGEIWFPGGELDITTFCRPGATQVISLFVEAMPLQAVLLATTRTKPPRDVKSQVARRGLCGDVFLVSTPSGARLTDVKVDTSVQKGEITVEAGLDRLSWGKQYTLRAKITSSGGETHEITGPSFKAADVKDGRIALTEAWRPDDLWDIHTPQNTCHVDVSLLDAAGKELDTSFRVRFGYRELWIDGRDFFLNGSRIFLSSVPLDNAQVGAAWATYEGARESLERLKSFGINFVATHNYGCEPGSHLSFAEILRAADDVGMLVALSQPHSGRYDWRPPDADQKNGYAQHAKFYVGCAQNHPSVVAYASDHNATGYDEDMNPDMIDGVQVPTHDPGMLKRIERALRAGAIVKRFDSGRIVYHHSSGNLGPLHTTNFYPNFVPIQELSDWFEHWATSGVKPVFTCEYAAPFSWDWGMFRGWYNGKRSWGNEPAPWDFCLAEWNSQFLGDAAFQTTEAEKANLRWEAKKFREGELWYRWGYPANLSSKRFDDRYAVIARYLTDNWRAFRTWGVSANSPWEHDHFWKLREDQVIDKGRRELPVDWEGLQRPGFSPDYLDQRYERMDLDFERADWVATPAAQALLRNNLPLLAWIAGKPAAFTSKDHVFYPGETVEKQLVVINNSRQSMACVCDWSLNLASPLAGASSVTLPTGDQARIALRFKLPEGLAPGEYKIRASVRFANGEIQEDSFVIDVVPRRPDPQLKATVALFDPRGETRSWLDQANIRYDFVDAHADLSRYDLLVVGKSALTIDGPAPDISRVSNGLRVLLFEQTADVLEQRFGFRVAEYGLRQVIPRVPDHSLVVGTGTEQWRDWRGAATLVPPRLTYEFKLQYGPMVNWCGIKVPRLWRCGNRGNVASVLIEKPARGDFLPIFDGGFSLQYAPLLEYREGRGLVLFCQMDVTGRTESEPAAEALAHNLLQYVADWKPAPRRSAVYVGEAEGRAHLESSGIAVHPYEQGRMTADSVLIVGPGGGQNLARDMVEIGDWLKAGGNLLAIGLDESDTTALPFKLGMRKEEHISASFDPFGLDSLFVGVGPADVHTRDPRELFLIASGAKVFGNGVLAQANERNVIFCQLAPWQFGGSKQPNLRKTFRRASFLLTRLLANMGVAGSTPVVSRFHAAVDAQNPDTRWVDGLYLDQPEEWDDPYRHFRW